jgi:hypothetical protein
MRVEAREELKFPFHSGTLKERLKRKWNNIMTRNLKIIIWKITLKSDFRSFLYSYNTHYANCLLHIPKLYPKWPTLLSHHDPCPAISQLDNCDTFRSEIFTFFLPSKNYLIPGIKTNFVETILCFHHLVQNHSNLLPKLSSTYSYSKKHYIICLKSACPKSLSPIRCSSHTKPHFLLLLRSCWLEFLSQRPSCDSLF